MTITKSEVQSGTIRMTGSRTTPVESEADSEELLRQRAKTRVSTSTKLHGTNRVMPALMTPLVDNWASNEETLTRIVDTIGEQSNQMSIKMRKLKRAIHVERESLREEINRNRHEVSRSEERLKEMTEEYLARSLSRRTREAEEKERRLRGDLEQLRSQQEQTLGTLDTGIDAMMERRTQAIMDRLYGPLGNRSGSSNRITHSREASREPRVIFNEHPNRGRTYGSTRGRGNSSSNATGNNRPRVQRI